jgi:hypothetical protein
MQAAARIPKRVPVGTKYVIEGKTRGPGQVQVFSRYLVFPDGRCIELPPDSPPAARPRRRRQAHKAPASRKPSVKSRPRQGASAGR